MTTKSAKMYSLAEGWHKSPQSKADYCKSIPINIHTFTYRVQKYNAQQSVKEVPKFWSRVLLNCPSTGRELRAGANAYTIHLLVQNFFIFAKKLKTNSSLSTPNYTNQELLDLLASDSRKAMEVIFRKYFSEMVQVVYRMIWNQERAEDLVQDVFLKFWHQRDALNITIAIKAYLRRSCVNACLDDIRKQKKVQHVDIESNLAHLETATPDAAKQLENIELETLIHRTIEGLSPKCQAVFVLSRQDEMTNQQIADHLGVTIKTVEAHITTALKTLRAVLKKNREND